MLREASLACQALTVVQTTPQDPRDGDVRLKVIHEFLRKPRLKSRLQLCVLWKVICLSESQAGAHSCPTLRGSNGFPEVTMSEVVRQGVSLQPWAPKVASPMGFPKAPLPDTAARWWKRVQALELCHFSEEQYPHHVWQLLGNQQTPLSLPLVNCYSVRVAGTAGPGPHHLRGDRVPWLRQCPSAYSAASATSCAFFRETPRGPALVRW